MYVLYCIIVQISEIHCLLLSVGPQVPSSCLRQLFAWGAPNLCVGNKVDSYSIDSSISFPSRRRNHVLFWPSALSLYTYCIASDKLLAVVLSSPSPSAVCSRPNDVPTSPV